MPLWLWESEVLLNAASWIAFIHAIAISIVVFGFVAYCLDPGPDVGQSVFFVGVFSTTAIVFLALGMRIRSRRATWVICVLSVLLFMVSSTVVYIAWGDILRDPYSAFWRPLEPFSTVLHVPANRLVWVLAYPWAIISIYMAWCLIRTASRPALRPCYQGVPLAPLWSRQAAGVRSIHLLIARAMVLQAGIFGVALSAYLAWYFANLPPVGD